MSTGLPSSTSIPLCPRTQAAEISAHDAHEQRSAFLRWLDNYFRATPEERMGDQLAQPCSRFSPTAPKVPA